MTRLIASALAACAFVGIALCGNSALALTAEQARALTVGETDARITALQQALASADEKTAAFLQAMADDAVKVSDTQVWVLRDGQALNPVTGEPQALAENAEDVINNNRMRGEIDAALLPCNC